MEGRRGREAWEVAQGAKSELQVGRERAWMWHEGGVGLGEVGVAGGSKYPARCPADTFVSRGLTVRCCSRGRRVQSWEGPQRSVWWRRGQWSHQAGTVAALTAPAAGSAAAPAPAAAALPWQPAAAAGTALQGQQQRPPDCAGDTASAATQ